MCLTIQIYAIFPHFLFHFFHLLFILRNPINVKSGFYYTHFILYLCRIDNRIFPLFIALNMHTSYTDIRNTVYLHRVNIAV